MKLRLVRAALGNYSRAVLVRENPPAISCALFILLVGLRIPHERHFVHAHGLATVFDHGFSGFVMMWWMLALFVPSCIARHYWRQVTTEISMAIPGVPEAEYGAVLIALLLAAIALATPLTALGGPLIGSMSVATLPMIGGMAYPQATGQSPRKRVLLALLLLPLSLIFLVPRSIGWLLFAPLWITLPMLLTTAGVVAAKLRYFPARALLQIDSLEHRIDQRVGAAYAAPPRGILQAIGHCMRWQPERWQEDALPRTQLAPFGPVGWGAYFAILMAFFIGLGMLLRVFHEPLAHAVHQSVLMAVTQLPIFGLIATGKWLLIRSDWPLLYLAGRHGTRNGFTRALFHAHRRIALQLAVSSGLVTFLVLTAFIRITHVAALTAGASLGALVFGLSYLVAIPLFWKELGGRGWNFALNFSAAMLAAIVMASGFGAHGLQFWLLPVSVVIAGAALIAEPVLARRLAQIDWIFETDSTGR